MKDDNYNIINPERTGKFIKDIRLYHNMTQEDLAEILFITRKAVSKWETGSGYPSIDVAKRLCDTFGINFEELIAGKYIEKNKKLAFNSTVFSIIIMLFIVVFTLYSDYLNKFDIYKFGFQSKSINIINNKILLSNKHHYYNFGSVTINDNTVSKKTKLKFNLFIKNKQNTLLYSCIYYNNKCHKKYTNTTISKTSFIKNINNLFLVVTYKDKSDKVNILIDKKVKINNPGTKRLLVKHPLIIPNSFFNNTNTNLLLYRLDNRALITNNNKIIDLSFLYKMTNKEIYKRYNKRKIKIYNELYTLYVSEYKTIIFKSNNGINYIQLTIGDNVASININKNRQYLKIKNKKLIISEENHYKILKKLIEKLKTL